MKPLYALLLFFITIKSLAQCWTQVAAGEFHTVALRSDGTLWAWGLNDKGQLGDGTTVNKTVPTQVGTDSDWAIVDAESSNTLAIKSDGSLWSWGSNLTGQIGDGNHGSGIINISPTRIGMDNDWVKIACARAFAIKSNGTLWGWGSNSDGRLGTGDMDPHYTPVQVGTDADWIDVSAGGNQTLALKADHTLWGWGLNKNGSLAIGPVNNFVMVPTQTGNGTADWVKISVGGCCSSKMIKMDGALWTMGAGNQGNNGTGQNFDLNVSTQIGSQINWVSLATANHTHAITSDGTLWGWGLNLSGQLGDSTFENKNLPIQIGSKTWLSVQHGLAHSIAIDTDGSLYTWGYNNNGQLGNGTLLNTNIPTLIGSNCNLANQNFNSPMIMSLYPNPASNTIFVEYDLTQAGNVEATLCNSVGQVLQRDSNNGAIGYNKIIISLKDLSAGIYLLIINSNGSKKSMKVIKE